MRKIKWCVAILGLIQLGSAFASPAIQTTVKVALAFRFAEAAQEGFTTSFVNGFELAQKQFAKSHPEYKFEFVKYPYTSKPENIHAIAQKIIKDGIKFVIGGESSDESRILGEEFERAHVFMITPTSSEPAVTAGKTYIYRTCFADDQVAKALARYVLGELLAAKKTSPVAVVHNTGNEYTHFLTKTFYEEITRLNREKGNKIKFVKKDYATENFNFTEMVHAFAADKVDTVVLLTGTEDFYHFVDAAQKQKWFPKYYGSDGWGTHQSIVETLGKMNLLRDFDGILNSYWQEESDRKEVKSFTTEYKSKFAHAPDGWAAIAYDSAKILFDGMAQAGADPTKVSQALKGGTFTGLVTTPKLKYENGNSPKKTLYLYEISANRPEFKAALE